MTCLLENDEISSCKDTFSHVILVMSNLVLTLGSVKVMEAGVVAMMCVEFCLNLCEEIPNSMIVHCLSRDW